MQAGSPNALSADDFFDLVETLLAPPMAALGYHSLHGSVNDQPSSRGVLTSTGRQPQQGSFLWFQFGFEADSDEVMVLVGPDDPQIEDEWWVNYEPATGRLELSDWKPVAGDSVDWDIWVDEGPCSPTEVRRRLESVGRAVSAFVAQRGGYRIAR